MCRAATKNVADQRAFVSEASRQPRRLLRFAANVGAVLLVTIVSVAAPLVAQQATPAAPTVQAQAAPGQAAPTVITLQDALARARAINPEFLAATKTELGIAREDRVQARASLLPSLTYTTQFLYTEGGRTGDVPRFIANNAVHEYIAQGNAHEEIGGSLFAAYSRAGAAFALAAAHAEIAARGLVVTVVQNYYGLAVAQRKYATAQAAAAEASRFLKISQDLERGGEVARSDVIKAQLQYNDRARDLQEADLVLAKSRLALAVLLFPNFDQNFTIVDDMRLPEPLPSLEEIQHLAAKQNPVMRAAVQSLRMAQSELTAARFAYLPTLALDYWYGIDAPTFATRTDGVRNLGYSAAATLELPVWNWFSTQSKVRQADLRRKQAQVELTAAQRELIANLESFYREANSARDQLDLLAKSADLAAESLRLTTLRYQGGEATVLEVVDAQNAFSQARNAYDDGEARYRVAVSNLQTLTGTF